ncbi:MAG: acetyl-CoA carboxylase, carboxyltransferase subunit beta [Sarcina sp.]
MIKNLLGKNKKNFITVSTVDLKEETLDVKPNIPTGMWSKCIGCNSIIYTDDLKKNLYVCPKCNYHSRINSKMRIDNLLDKDSFKEFDKNLLGNDPLNFPGYAEKLNAIKSKTGLNEAVTTGRGYINNKKIIICIMDSEVLMGSMGSAVGEKITRAIEVATKEALPLIILTSSGGARMQEGIFSLMQMAKVSGAIQRYSESGGLYITILTDPTTGGVTASFAMEGDIILSEPNCTIGFAGRRVIEKTINEKLPSDFQKSEFLLEKGFVDKIVSRKDLRNILDRILQMHEVKNE